MLRSAPLRSVGIWCMQGRKFRILQGESSRIQRLPWYWSAHLMILRCVVNVVFLVAPTSPTKRSNSLPRGGEVRKIDASPVYRTEPPPRVPPQPQMGAASRLGKVHVLWCGVKNHQQSILGAKPMLRTVTNSKSDGKVQVFTDSKHLSAGSNLTNTLYVPFA